MSRNKALQLLCFAFIVFVIGPYVIVAQNALTGDWTADAKDEKPDRIQLNFEFRRENGGRNQHGSSFSYSDLRGLSPDQPRMERSTSASLGRPARSSVRELSPTVVARERSASRRITVLRTR